jgi:phage tail-like protein
MISNSSLLPRIPEPPHDPTSLRLHGVSGWPAIESGFKNIQIGHPDGRLMLAFHPEVQRSLTEPSGSFGGLRPPFNVALGPGEEVYLLDRESAMLKLFDPCVCTFAALPCFSGAGPAPRQLQQPGGITICGGNLFVCDTGNNRLSVYALRGYVLRGHWTPPQSLNLNQPWTPHSVACDAHGKIYVSDPANGCIHMFSPTGRWMSRIDGLGFVTFLTFDCKNRLLAILQSGVQPEARIIHSNGQTELLDPQPDALAEMFPPLPFEVDRNGRLHLKGLCSAENASGPDCEPDSEKEPGLGTKGIFNLDGSGWNPPQSEAPKSLPPYATSGIYISQALDSNFYRCQWHRIILTGETPPGSYVTVSSFTSEVPIPDSEIHDLTNESWETQQVARIAGGMWDCLVRSREGRYLWLRLEFRSGGMVTPVLRSVEIEFPRISLRRFLPAVFGEEPVSADFTDRFLALFDTTLRSMERKLDHLASYFDPLSAPAGKGKEAGHNFLDWLASWIGISLEQNWPEIRKRHFLKQASRVFPLRGTRLGLWRQLLLYMDIDPEQCCTEDHAVLRCTPQPQNCRVPEKKTCGWEPPHLILEHYQLRRWLFLGAGKLDDQSVLWGESIANRSRLNENAQADVTQLKTAPDPVRDPFMVYAHRFTVFVPACHGKTEAERRSLESMVQRESPAHTHFDVRYVEPRFRIGVQSMIGLDSVIGQYPEGVTLDGTLLGPSSVLGAPSHKRGGPSFEIGTGSRIGSTTLLD